jgi:hypothetical protein
VRENAFAHQARDSAEQDSHSDEGGQIRAGP